MQCIFCHNDIYGYCLNDQCQKYKVLYISDFGGIFEFEYKDFIIMYGIKKNLTVVDHIKNHIKFTVNKFIFTPQNVEQKLPFYLTFS